MHKKVNDTEQASSDFLAEWATLPILLLDKKLNVEDTVAVINHECRVMIPENTPLTERVDATSHCIQEMVQQGMPIYGVTTGFGGMANVVITPEHAADLQNNMIWYHKTGAGGWLPLADVKAAMLIQAHSLLQGVSGLRLAVIRRIVKFLNAGVTPYVPELGSIGASGDLVPLTYISGAVLGFENGFQVDFEGEQMEARAALARLGMKPMKLEPKEGLSLINGTAVMTGIAVNCVHEMQTLFALTLGAHALSLQAMRGTNQSFHAFIHSHKPHSGQVWTAQQMLALLEGSQMSRDELDGSHDYRENELIQDRYSMRCLAQYLGPVADGIHDIRRHVETEMNSITDNPLVDVDTHATFHGGNFLGEYIGVSMDQLRYYVGLMAKHLDAQIALMVAPQFNYGLSASLLGNPDRPANMGLKGLQIAGNSIVPLLLFYGNSITDRYMTHAEQFNQNVNSQGFNSANLARKSLEIFRNYVAMALIFAVQGVDLRTHQMVGHYDARELLSPASRRLYEAVREVVGVMPSQQRPYVWNDNEIALDWHVSRLAEDIAKNGLLPEAIERIINEYRPQY